MLLCIGSSLLFEFKFTTKARAIGLLFYACMISLNLPKHV